jgi:hypothetical protein
MATITVKRIVAALRQVPEKRFRIMELAPQLLDDNGKVSVVKAMDAQGDLNMAILEVETYIKQSRNLRQTLSNMSGKDCKGNEVVDVEYDDEVDE